LIVSLVALGAAGCHRSVQDAVDDEALQAINEAVAAQLNEPPQAIVKLLKDLDRPTPIGLESLQIPLDQKVVPIDWWLMRHDLVEVISPAPSPDRPTFLVSPRGAQLAAQGPMWFTAAAGEPTKVDCHSGDVTAAGGCEVELSVIPQLTGGAAGLGAAPLDPIKLEVLVSSSDEGWQVRDIRTRGPGLRDYAVTALLGSDQARAASRQQAMANLNLAVAMTPAATPPGEFGGLSTGGDLSPPADLAPVIPVVGDNPYSVRRPH
jgi:hypothetical protein